MGASAKQFLSAAVAGLSGLVIAAPAARADSIQELQLDINSITIQATNLQGGNTAFGGAHHTGMLVFTMDGDSTIGLSLDGVAQNSFNAVFFGLSGQITFVDGQSQGGSMTVMVKNLSDSSVDTYSFDIAAGSCLTRPIGQSSFHLLGFQLDADTQAGHFNDNNYGGTNITPFYNAQNPDGLFGAFFQLKYVPNANGYSNAADIDLLTVAEVPSFSQPVPLPSSAVGGLGLAGLLAVAQWRRRAGSF